MWRAHAPDLAVLAAVDTMRHRRRRPPSRPRGHQRHLLLFLERTAQIDPVRQHVAAGLAAGIRHDRAEVAGHRAVAGEQARHDRASYGIERYNPAVLLIGERGHQRTVALVEPPMHGLGALGVLLVRIGPGDADVVTGLSD